jgi:hypothetical protein
MIQVMTQSARTAGVAALTLLVMLTAGLLALVITFSTFGPLLVPRLLILLIFGSLFGSLVGSFRAWLARQTNGPQSLILWLLPNISLSLMGIIGFTLGVNALFPLDRVMAVTTGLGIGLLYGLLFGSIISAVEHWLLRPYLSHPWQTAIISLVAWSGWWCVVGLFTSSMSGMD